MSTKNNVTKLAPESAPVTSEVVAPAKATSAQAQSSGVTVLGMGAARGLRTHIHGDASNQLPENIEVYGARVHNLKNIDVKVPLQKMVAIAGVSGSGKSSLALGVLYAEGSRRYLEALSTYTRRRISEASKPEVDEVLYVPAALALRQRPGVPSIRSTFGTGSELLNSVRLMFSRLASHRCPNGHYIPPTIECAAMIETHCPVCGALITFPGAEQLAFNSEGACPCCEGTGEVRTVDESTLINEELCIEDGAVLPWGTLMWSLMIDICREMGVRTNIPYKDLTAEEKEIVLHGPAEKKHILYLNKNTGQSTELDFTYYNAVYTVENALAKVKDEKGMKRVEKFLKIAPCPECHGTRLSEAARAPVIMGHNLADVCTLSLSELHKWVHTIPSSLPDDMQEMAHNIIEAFDMTARRLLELGLGYLSLDRASSTLSTGERQRMQLARAVRNRTTGVMYVLDEPSIGLHPANLIGLLGVIRDLLHDGNSVIVVDHDTQVLVNADYMIEMGPAAGAQGGQVLTQGTIEEIIANPQSTIGPFLREARDFIPQLQRATKQIQDYFARPHELTPSKSDTAVGSTRPVTATATASAFATGTTSETTGATTAGPEIYMHTLPLHTVHELEVHIPQGKLTVVTGVSGSGKTTMVLESLIPALQASINGQSLPPHVASISAPGIKQVKLIDATPIGINVRSTVATYANVLDELRKVFAHTASAKEHGYKAGDFSYNTGKLRCACCDGTGSISLDVQFLPDVDIPCPECHGKRYSPAASEVYFDFTAPHHTKSKTLMPEATTASEATEASAATDASAAVEPAATQGKKNQYTLPEILALDIDSALELCQLHPAFKLVVSRLKVLSQLGLGYLTLGEATPNLSGGEAQRLKLASEMGRMQQDSVFIFDEPTIGLHPLDVQSLLRVLDSLLEHQATVIVIEHDRDLIAHADHIIDMGPGGGIEGGTIVACGTPEHVAASPVSLTGKFLHLPTEGLATPAKKQQQKGAANGANNADQPDLAAKPSCKATRATSKTSKKKGQTPRAAKD